MIVTGGDSYFLKWLLKGKLVILLQLSGKEYHLFLEKVDGNTNCEVYEDKHGQYLHESIFCG